MFVGHAVLERCGGTFEPPRSATVSILSRLRPAAAEHEREYAHDKTVWLFLRDASGCTGENYLQIKNSGFPTKALARLVL
jgi:hypothetical protein